MTAKAEFTVDSRHAEELASGRPVAPGERFTLSKEDQQEPHNLRMVEEGIFRPVVENWDGPSYEELQKEAKKLDIPQSGTKGELAERISAERRRLEAEKDNPEGGGE